MTFADEIEMNDTIFFLLLVTWSTELQQAEQEDDDP